MVQDFVHQQYVSLREGIQKQNIAHKRTYFDVNFCDKAFYNKNTQSSIFWGTLVPHKKIIQKSETP